MAKRKARKHGKRKARKGHKPKRRKTKRSRTAKARYKGSALYRFNMMRKKRKGKGKSKGKGRRKKRSHSHRHHMSREQVLQARLARRLSRSKRVRRVRRAPIQGPMPARMSPRMRRELDAQARRAAYFASLRARHNAKRLPRHVGSFAASNI